MEFEAFGKTFRFGSSKSSAEPEEQKTPEQLAEEVENFEFVADIATINAIPEEITRRYRVRGVAKKQGIILAGIVVAFGLLWGGSSAFLAFQHNKVAELNQERDLLQQEADALSPFQEYKQALDNKRTVLSNSTQTDINYGSIYNILTTSSEANGVKLRSIEIAQFEEEGETGACISPDPLNQTSGIIGCVSLTAATPNETQLISFLRALENNPTVEGGFILPSVASFSNEGSSAGGEEAGPSDAAVNMSIFFTYKFYSNKYEDLTIPLEELIASGVSGSAEDSGKSEEPEMTFEDKMTTISFKVSDELSIENSIDNLEILTNVATEVCETGEISETQQQLDSLSSLSSVAADDILTAVREKC